MTLEKNSKSPKMFLNIEAFHFEIMSVENNHLKFYNRFDYQTKEDFIYYVLFTIEQIQLNPEEFPVVLMGSVNESDELYQIAIQVHKTCQLITQRIYALQQRC